MESHNAVNTENAAEQIGSKIPDFDTPLGQANFYADSAKIYAKKSVEVEVEIADAKFSEFVTNEMKEELDKQIKIATEAAQQAEKAVKEAEENPATAEEKVKIALNHNTNATSAFFAAKNIQWTVEAAFNEVQAKTEAAAREAQAKAEAAERDQYYSLLVNMVERIVSYTDLWKEEYGDPSLNKRIIKIPQQLTSEEKWKKMVEAAQKPATQDTWLGFFVNSRNERTTEFCNAILLDNNNALDALKSVLKIVEQEAAVHAFAKTANAIELDTLKK